MSGAARGTGDPTRRREQFIAERYTRSGLEGLAGHLESAHGIAVREMEELDLGVYRVARRDGPSWVARVFPAVRPVERAAGDAEILRWLADQDFPAERCAVADPITELDGQAVLVTALVEAAPRTQRAEVIRSGGGYTALGELLARLHGAADVDAALGRTGGGWHHLTDGTPVDEVAAALAFLADAEDLVAPAEAAEYEALRAEVAGLDGGAGLPEAFVHPDFVLANVVAAAEGGMVVVDWTGAGRSSRAFSLAFLLYAAGGQGLGRVDRVVTGYRRAIQLEPEELDRLEAMIRVRPVIFAAWGFCMGRRGLAETLAAVADARRLAATIAELARDGLAREGSTGSA